MHSPFGDPVLYYGKRISAFPRRAKNNIHCTHTYVNNRNTIKCCYEQLYNFVVMVRMAAFVSVVKSVD